MGKFESTPTPLEGLKVIQPTVLGDSRGFFMENYSVRDFAALGINETFVQDNHSKSRRGVLRGLHFQTSRPQAKLIRVIAGSVFDVAVDLRPESATFGGWFGLVLSAQNNLQLYVPPRFAHGFLTLEEETEFLYKCSEYYDSASDGGIAWNDPAIGVEWSPSQWGIEPDQLLLSEKDKNLPALATINKSTLWK